MPTKSPEGADPKQRYNVALVRLIIVAAVGCILIVLYGFRNAQGSVAIFFGIVSVGVMTGGAALLSGGLLGFLFGVPHTRAGESVQSNQETTENESEQARLETPEPSTSYRPNTGLEQISDWLTKMLVGVGLIEIKIIPAKLTALAAYIARGLGNEPQGEVFALTTLIYFSVCGFVFGFLWARLSLMRWFREADEVQKLARTVSRLERQQQADAKALMLINQQINREADEPPTSEAEVADAIKESSRSVKVQIFNQTKKASENSRSRRGDADVSIEGVISILKGLIASDVSDIYHQNHSELSYALHHKKPPDLLGAENEITKAIEIRNKLGKTGWKYYEFHRARCRIRQDPNLEKGIPSDPSSKQRILADLKVASSQTDKWERWYESDLNVKTWLAINNIDVAQLGKS